MKKEEYLKKYSKEIFYLLLFLIMILTLLFFIKPKINQILDLKREVEKNKLLLTNLTKKVSLLESLDEAELTSKSEKLLKTLPAEMDISFILMNLKTLASSEGVNIERIQVDLGDSKKNGGLKSFSFKINIEGESVNVKSFLRRIENIIPILRIKKLSLNFQKGFQSSLEIETYYLSLPQTLGKLEKEVPLLTSQEEKIYKKISTFEEINFPEVSLEQEITGKDNPFSY